MLITLDLCYGPDHWPVVTKKNIQENIDAIDRAIANKKLGIDDNYLINTKYILIEIQKRLPDIE